MDRWIRRAGKTLPQSPVEMLESRTLMSTYYVGAGGSDANAGTSTAAAWASIAKVNAVNLNPGDRVLFEGGRSFTGNLRFDATDDGTAAAPITVSSYGTGRATIRQPLAGGEAINVQNTAGYVISNLNVVGKGPQ